MKWTSTCLVAGAILMSGCDKVGPMLARHGYIHDLGDYAVRSVKFVPELPPYGHRWGTGRYLKVELASSRQLHNSYPTYWIGIASDYCPMKADDRLMAIGVLDQHGVMIDRYQNKRIQKSETGSYHYHVFVPAEAPPAKPDHDIVIDKRDICLQIFGGDHYNVFARSSVIRIPFKRVERAANAAGVWVTRPKRQ